MTDLYQNQKKSTESVECLGMTFPNDDVRRAHYLNLLTEKLKDPEFRKLSGFPTGTDEAILAMSDPPYYTACPNPFLSEFIKLNGKPYTPDVKYVREPLAIDVSVGKTDALFKAHSYHTKVPHLAIVPSILHYTEPGDIVLDVFAGSGMTGVAAQWCGAAPAVYRHELEVECKKQNRPAPKWGSRRVILNDLAPAATFIAANYNQPFDVAKFAVAATLLLEEVGQEIGWMYETLHSDGKSKGRIEYTLWSEIFSCPSCAGEIVFTEEALDEGTKRVMDVFACPRCDTRLTKKTLDKTLDSRFDSAIGRVVAGMKRKPTLICYEFGGARYEKKLDSEDLAVLDRISKLPWPADLPADRMMHVPDEQGSWGDKWRAGTAAFTHVHHLFLPRPAQALGALWRKADSQPEARLRNMLIFLVEQAIWTCSTLNRYQPQGFKQVNKFLPGVYYTPSQTCEVSPWYAIGARGTRLSKTFSDFRSSSENLAVSTGTAFEILIPDSSVDYIFTDPPFGDNLAYSELNFLVEAFHGVFTAQGTEAVMSAIQDKGLLEYYRLMRACFSECFRVLKPGRWMTVVFSNTQAAVWNGIQTALQEAGFVIANVSALDKQLGSFNAVTNATSVKQDLVISAYKPNGGLEERFRSTGATSDSVWDFVRTHLGYLPVVKQKADALEFIKERDPRIIFDRMIAWFVKHGHLVPLSSQEFQAELARRFDCRDGMVFLPEQASEYDKKRALVSEAPQFELFISDEKSAIGWLSDLLKKRPSTYSEITPEYMPVVGAAKKKGEVIPELDHLLDDNFLKFDGKGDVPPQISSWLSRNFHEFRGLTKDDPRLVAKAKDRWFLPDASKAQDLEKKRDKALLKEFERYVAATSRKLKDFRLEVLRCGFKAAWAAKDYATIIKVAHKLPEEALQEDEKLLTLYDMALTRTEAGG
jgi:16S rRNA G966 N2-methylase RsmD